VPTFSRLLRRRPESASRSLAGGAAADTEADRGEGRGRGEGVPAEVPRKEADNREGSCLAAKVAAAATGAGTVVSRELLALALALRRRCRLAEAVRVSRIVPLHENRAYRQ
jgi:hypothetical protein